ncbi:hypothetical protein PMAYCL1PPCAC_19744 [Pristionchus mayeri]|uniref:Uncharacterized protein n=1 Tax=Pristionchus mayeri TaxID=1317129 RepID=A0AAN5CS30_9BILA|nr:hypothetical protein PMAYCL1PPCAC_19744 [Pristionchus mayeri]
MSYHSCPCFASSTSLRLHLCIAIADSFYAFGPSASALYSLSFADSKLSITITKRDTCRLTCTSLFEVMKNYFISI